MCASVSGNIVDSSEFFWGVYTDRVFSYAHIKLHLKDYLLLAHIWL